MHNNATYINILEDVWEILEKSEDQNVLPATKFLYSRLKNPQSYISFIGETSSGKSTLINSFLNCHLLETKASPTTGIVTWLEYGEFKEKRYLAINRDASFEELSYENFKKLSVKPDKDLLRLKLEIPAEKKSFVGLNIFDTPGYDSIVIEHEEILREFIPDSDVIIFPISYRVGFGEKDRQLMDVIYNIFKHLGDIPIILVVNRVAEGIQFDDKRIKEIKFAAEDAIHKELPLLIVNTAMPDENGNRTLPNTEKLWQEISNIAFSEERKQWLDNKNKEFICSLLNQVCEEFQNKVLVSENNCKEIEDCIKKQLCSLSEAEEQSLKIVDKYIGRLETQLPKQISYGVDKLQEVVTTEIYNASKWKDIYACRNFVFNHTIPFGITKICRDLETYLFEIFKEMDQELDEIAAKPRFAFEQQILEIKNPKIKEVMQNLALKYSSRIGGEIASSMLKNIGGIGGAAAGAGNIAKKTLKKIGGLFGKKFSRDVYAKIGKFFSNKALAKLNILFNLAVEAIAYAWESNRWQGKLEEETHQAILKWKEEICFDLENHMIEEYRQINIKNVNEVYKEARIDSEMVLSTNKQNFTLEQINKWKEEIIVLKNNLDKLKGLENEQ